MTTAVLKAFAVSLCLFLVFQELVAAPASFSDYDNFRDLYELLLRNDGLTQGGQRFTHQMERKGGRSPSLRLRFGRRADPLWEAAMSSESGAQSASGPDNPSA